MNHVKKTLVFAAALGGLWCGQSLSAQTVATVQTFGVTPQANGWKSSFQVSRFLPADPGDTLVKVTIDLSAHTEFPAFTATAKTDGSTAHASVTETINV